MFEGLGGLCRVEGRDEVVSLRRSHPSASMRLAVQLALHKEVAPLLEVDVAVGAHKAAGVAVLVPRLHHRPAAGHTRTAQRQILDHTYCIFNGECIKAKA